MTIKLGHKALAETEYFCVALALRIEVCATLAAADGKAGKAVFEDLLEAEELHDANVYGRMEAKTSLVRSDCIVKLYTETTVNVSYALIIGPRNSEHYLTIGFYKTLKQSVLTVFSFVSFDNLRKSVKNFVDSLNKFSLSRISLLCHFHNF